MKLQKMLGLQSKVGLEAVKEHVEADVISIQIDTLTAQINSQIIDNLEDHETLTELETEIKRLKATLEERNERYYNLLNVLEGK